MISLIKRKNTESTMQITLNTSQEGRIYDSIVRKEIVRKIPSDNTYFLREFINKIIGEKVRFGRSYWGFRMKRK